MHSVRSCPLSFDSVVKWRIGKWKREYLCTQGTCTMGLASEQGVLPLECGVLSPFITTAQRRYGQIGRLNEKKA